MTHSVARTVLHELHLIHTDLKPENILLVNNDHQVVQVPTSSKVGAFCPVYQHLLTTRWPLARRANTKQADTPLDRYPPYRLRVCDLRRRVPFQCRVNAALSRPRNHPWYVTCIPAIGLF